jgi:hypothetical protein
MGPFSIGASFMFIRWFFECLYMLFHLSRYVEPRKGITSKAEYFAYLDTLPR